MAAPFAFQNLGSSRLERALIHWGCQTPQEAMKDSVIRSAFQAQGASQLRMLSQTDLGFSECPAFGTQGVAKGVCKIRA